MCGVTIRNSVDHFKHQKIHLYGPHIRCSVPNCEFMTKRRDKYNLILTEHWRKDHKYTLNTFKRKYKTQLATIDKEEYLE